MTFYTHRILFLTFLLHFTTSQNTSRDSKFLGLFNVVQFANDVCNSTVNNEQGICYTSQECNRFGGKAVSPCASGFGVCFVKNCRGDRSMGQEIMYFQNDNYPDVDRLPNMCMLSIPIKDTNICQLRLDFIEFDLDPGSQFSSPCDQDYLEIFTNSGSDGLGTGKLCGNNKGQHLYISLMSQFDSPSMRIVTDMRESSEESGKRGYRWNIKITQIDCNSASSTSELKAPDGCLQKYVPNQNYAICIQRSISDCELRLRRSAGIPKGSTSIGKPLTGGTCGVNGCGVNDCIKSSGGNNDIEHIYCGEGVGSTKARGNNNNNNGDEVEASEIISQTKGPFVSLLFLLMNSQVTGIQIRKHQLGCSTVQRNKRNTGFRVIEIDNNNSDGKEDDDDVLST
ncbi:unnamed protein product [Lepeophtheirus salmonis]|uniref:(salmon louse) hypothetical protein n=1 Tax=Lepeophtheirus salmonis TaxID=72036 RepID=A0A7R8HD96_LEPSM|nr:unnamed protein product [Lepeophtheirus salmonis]CAF3025900.1 unnamed protein product [Lepeophtheirus salmonis]